MGVQKPKMLRVRGGAFWRRVMGEFDLDDVQRALLERACIALDRAEEARGEIEARGIILDGKMVRANPAVKAEKDSTALFSTLVRQLGLDLEPLQEGPGRPAS